MSDWLLYAMCFHVAWAALLYVVLTVLRAPGIWGLDTRSGGIRRCAALESRVSANLSNQFEWPVVFYAAGVLALVAESPVSGLQVTLAWLFIAGRIAHSMVQILSTNIRLRGAVFTLNFLAVVLLWLTLVVSS